MRRLPVRPIRPPARQNDQWHGNRFLYDGVNPVQELSGTTVTANLLTGLGVDEYFTRTDEYLGNAGEFGPPPPPGSCGGSRGPIPPLAHIEVSG